MTNTTLIPTLGSDLLICDITQISTTHTGIRAAVLIRNRLNTNWELTPLILFMKELLVGIHINAIILKMCFIMHYLLQYLHILISLISRQNTI